MSAIEGPAFVSSVHQQVRALAAEFGVSTDDVMFMVGVYNSELCATCDPLMAEKLGRLMQAVPDRARMEAFSVAVKALIVGMLKLGQDLPEG